jgi:hypothetical protein
MTFTSDYSKLVVANEAEPSDDYTVDPEVPTTHVSIDITALIHINANTHIYMFIYKCG